MLYASVQKYVYVAKADYKITQELPWTRKSPDSLGVGLWAWNAPFAWPPSAPPKKTSGCG
jgi:hypothetical protein